MELKKCHHGLVDHVVNIWVKQTVSPLDESDPVRWQTPTYPYQIKQVDQVFPNKAHLEDFEARRNEIDERMNKGKVKLETIQGFYCPSSDENLARILKDGFHNAIVGELTFCTDALQAIRESLNPRPSKVILARVSLGWKEYDYREINNKYKIKNLRGVLPSFVIHVDPVQHERAQAPEQRRVEVVAEPQYPSYHSPPPTHTSPTTNDSPNNSNAPVRLPKYMRDLGRDEFEGGIACVGCGRVAGPGSSGRFCIGCGERIP